MKAKTIVTAVLLCFVAVSVIALIVKEAGKGTAVDEPTAKTPARKADSSDRLIAYYFHGTARCESCIKIETYSRSAIEAGFPDLLKSGRLEYRTVNTDIPANEHYLDDYQLYTKSVVLADMDGDKQVRWKNLEKVWDLLDSEDTFVRYVQDEVKQYLREE
jgi:hypothetical protein